MNYYQAIHACCDRYRDMLYERAYSTEDPLWVFVHQLMFASRDESIPLMKANRWLGYIQGCMIERGYTTVEEERNWTRPLFRPLDFGKE